MKKIIILSVLGAITIACIFFGTYKHTNQFFPVIHIGRNADKNIYDSNEKREINTQLDKFDSIEINGYVAGLEIQTGKYFHFYSNYNRSQLRPEYKIENGTLKISQNPFKTTVGNNTCNLKITVPASTKLNTITIKVNVGDIEITDLHCIDINSTTNVGKIKISNVDFTNAEVKTNVGEVLFKQIDGIEDFNVELETNVGEITVYGNNYHKNFKQKAKTSNHIKAKTNVGEIRIK